MKETLAHALYFAYLSARKNVSKATGYTALSTIFAIYGDLVHPFRNTIQIGALTFAGLTVIALLTLAAVSYRHRPLIQPAAGGGYSLILQKLPLQVRVSRDASEICALATALFAIFWVGQRMVTKTAPEGYPAEAQQTVSLIGTLIPQLNGLRSEVAGVREEVHAVRNTLANVKHETSDDPRKELANIGVPWSGDAFLESVRSGDLRVIDLFLAGGMAPESALSQGRALPIMLALNVSNPGLALDHLVGADLDLNHVYEVPGGLSPVRSTLLSWAIMKGNWPLADALVRNRADMNAPVETIGAMGLSRDTYPLAAAIAWRQLDIAATLLDAGADPKVGDFLAYREAQVLLSKTLTDLERQELDALAIRLAPSGQNAVRIENELRLTAVETELNAVAIHSLRAVPGSSQKAQLDRQYQDLQSERTALRLRLGLNSQRR